jgi:hypothetical protein
VIDVSILFLINSIISVIVPVSTIILAIILIRKFSGKPFVSKENEENLEKVTIVTGIWTAARLVLY